MQIENVTNWKKLNREERGKLIYETLPIKEIPQGWRVQSQSNCKIVYVVKYKKHKPECDCRDCQIAKKKCKHIYAVEYYLKKKVTKEGKVTQTKGIRITYGQKWSAYDKAQTNEKIIFMKLLKDLVSNVDEQEYKFGRPTLPMQDLLFSSVMKIYTTFSLRRFISDIKIAQEKGLINNVPCFASIGHFIQKEEITPILKELIKISSLPLRSVEKDFAVDSSGFSTSRFARYFNTKWGKDSTKRIWIKAHLMSGVKTNIVVNCEITESRGNDSPQLAPLLKGVDKRFDIKEVSCDRAYSSRKNLELISDVGATPYIPFKKGTTARTCGMTMWRKMYHYFLYKHEDFLSHYHKRSNAETVFYQIKTKFRDNLRSKTKTAQINELLLKVLCHNICVVIQEMMELGIKGEFVLEKE
ncbi:transposase [archaeon]|nr:transposase [archaeon]